MHWKAESSVAASEGLRDMPTDLLEPRAQGRGWLRFKIDAKYGSDPRVAGGRESLQARS
jgi:hypothetical protein